MTTDSPTSKNEKYDNTVFKVNNFMSHNCTEMNLEKHMAQINMSLIHKSTATQCYIS